MEPTEQKPDDGTSRSAGNYAKYTGIAFQMLAIIGLFVFIGYKSDEALNHTTKWITAIASIAGIMISLYIVIKSLKN